MISSWTCRSGRRYSFSVSFPSGHSETGSFSSSSLTWTMCRSISCSASRARSTGSPSLVGWVPWTNRWATYWSGSQSFDDLPSMSVMSTYGSSAANRAISRPANVLPRRGWAPISSEIHSRQNATLRPNWSRPNGTFRQIDRCLQSSSGVRPGGLGERVGVEDAQRVTPLGLLVAGEVDLRLGHVQARGDLGLRVHHRGERAAVRQVDDDLAALVERVAGHRGAEPEVVGRLLRVGASTARPARTRGRSRRC